MLAALGQQCAGIVKIQHAAAEQVAGIRVVVHVAAMAVSQHVAPVFRARVDDFLFRIRVQALLDPAQASHGSLLECAGAVPDGQIHVIGVLDELRLDLSHGLVVLLRRQDLVILAHALLRARDPLQRLAPLVVDQWGLAAIQ
ncbi:hypothetical protein D3C71_1535620 [compost metagenome]